MGVAMSVAMSAASVTDSRRRMAAEPDVDAEVAREHGLVDAEYQLLCGVLGRRPSFTELGIASALYSEHCSYKSSRVWLGELPTRGSRVVEGPGENAGVVDLGHGLVAAFKMESHNHPSFIEPYQGAATGVGGILRDIFTMGARPIACLDALRFGAVDAPRMRHLIDGVVRGIGDYGNCVGIPTVGGETGFHPAYNDNILVNAFALGICRREEIFRARAAGTGNGILYAGSRTGRDGIHGATMASESFDESSEAKRPTVQVGDPFTEKVVLEASLEAMASGVVVAVQDMGAAGLTSSCFEMAGRGGTGFELDLERVPLREHALTPYEIMLSESQERMVLVAEAGKEELVEAVFQRWGLPVVRVGRVTDSGRALLRFDGEIVADMPIEPMVNGAPRYERAATPPSDLAARQAAPTVPECTDPRAALETLLGSPEFGDKSWIWEQYDSTVRGNTVVGPGGDAAVLRIKGTPSAIALTTDVNPCYCALDPRRGAAQAVVEAARNLACVGAEPIGVTDCLNFGNPENPVVAWQLRESIRGMADACRALEIPVVSGNVSLYNETQGRSILPTPAVAMVGWLERLPTDSHRTLTGAFWRDGDRVVILGRDRSEFGGSAYLRLLFGIEQGLPPEVDLAREAVLGRLLRRLVASGLVSACHDLSEGGLAIALAEAAVREGVGAVLRIAVTPTDLFSETQGRALVTVRPEAVDMVLGWAEQLAVPAVDVGRVGGSMLDIAADGERLKAPVEGLRQIWSSALPRALEASS